MSLQLVFNGSSRTLQRVLESGMSKVQSGRREETRLYGIHVEGTTKKSSRSATKRRLRTLSVSRSPYLSVNRSRRRIFSLYLSLDATAIRLEKQINFHIKQSTDSVVSCLRGNVTAMDRQNIWLKINITDSSYRQRDLESIIFVTASHQTGLDTRSKARRPIKVGIKGRGRSETSRDSNPAGLCCSSIH